MAWLISSQGVKVRRALTYNYFRPLRLFDPEPGYENYLGLQVLLRRHDDAVALDGRG